MTSNEQPQQPRGLVDQPDTDELRWNIYEVLKGMPEDHPMHFAFGRLDWHLMSGGALPGAWGSAGAPKDAPEAK